MRRTQFAVSLGVALALTAMAGVGAAHAAPPEGEGWVSLFNGENFEGWRIEDATEGIWTIQDGVIDCFPRRDLRGQKDLWSEQEFEDFVLHVDWRIKEAKGTYNMPTILPDGSYKTDEDGNVIVTPTPNADSGVYLRGSSKAQVNIWCWPVGSGEVWGYRTDESMPPEVRAGVTPNVNADNPVGEWNTFVITVRGNALTVELNGQTVIDNVELPGLPERGPIALQHHGGYDPETDTWDSAPSLVQFRNIYVKPLENAGE